MSLERKWRDAPHVLVAGQMFETSRTPQRIEALRRLGCNVECIATTPEGHDYETRPTLSARIRHRLRLPADPAQANQNILATLNAETRVLWLDAADMIHGRTLREAKRLFPHLAIVWYGEDDMMNPSHRTRWIEGAMPYVDLWVTTKSFNTQAAEIPSLGVRHMLFVNNSCDPAIHRPVTINDAGKAEYGAPISFIGTFEQPRANSVLKLAQAGYEVRVWGNGWQSMAHKHQNLKIEGRPAYNDAFAKVVAASGINLCFLRHGNRDLQTCRSVEIPGCGGFMAHERNSEIQSLFRENIEAVYFSNDDELIALCAAWLDKPQERKAISHAANARVQELHLDHDANMTRILNELTTIGALPAA